MNNAKSCYTIDTRLKKLNKKRKKNLKEKKIMLSIEAKIYNKM